MNQLRPYFEQNKQRFLDELLSLLRYPSISADKNYEPEVLKTAEAVKDFLVQAGADQSRSNAYARTTSGIRRENYRQNVANSFGLWPL
jgi:acetylornithine deacetylase/succinyl-diaminopimelate desuccinylase-like protein